ncbi:MAG: arginine--tRNA ligase [Parcubacteria group bacterium CG11_big_fil_rev_8_21_14_0_20_39_22]|nr:MAG: arginine--tRNA ligase [Parcubacteria group bacterium CG11_big_fil_rev_8_21_14_0_20_39_22]
MKIKEKLNKLIKESIRIIYIASDEQRGDIFDKVMVEEPNDKNHGDYSFPVMKISPTFLNSKRNAKKMGVSEVMKGEEDPRKTAELIKSEIEKNKPEWLERVEIAGPGFINFFLSKEYFASSLRSANIEVESLKGENIFVEHTQPNPFKEFHIGHLMNNVIGEAISRILKVNGATVKTATYHGDVGLHVAKAIWAVLNYNLDKVELVNGQAYAKGNNAYEEREEVKKEILEINKKIYDRSDEKINELYDEGRKKSFENFERLYGRLGSKFDFHFYESESGEIGKDIVLKKKDEGVFEESDGAVVFKGEKYGLHTRVFLNKEGLPTYEAKEVGLAKIKKDSFSYDKSVTVTANEQDSFFDVVEKAIGDVYPDLSGVLNHISHGMLKLPSGKMSSRTGNVITAESLVDIVKEKVVEVVKERGFTKEESEEVSEKVALAALRYSILRGAIGGDIIFDIEKSISFEGDSGPYLQYAHTRAKSVLEKAKQEGVDMNFDLPVGWESVNLERLIVRFPEIVERAGREYAPHLLVTYLTELAGEFNSWYGREKIVDLNDLSSGYKLAITQSFANVMERGLWLLGIEIAKKM